METRPRIYRILFSQVYPLYVAKAEKKGRTRAEVDEIIRWLTGYDGDGVRAQLESGADMEAFFRSAPRIHPDAAKIRGSVCGVRVEAIEDETTRMIRCLDKLIDELAKGWTMEKILRK